MRLLTGTHYHSLDSKGRLTIPSKLRMVMSDGGTLSEGLEDCLYFYPAEAWQEQAAKLLALDDMAQEVQDAWRKQFTSAEECVFDKQGRITIPANLRETAKIDKDVAVVGVGNRIEIWDSDGWRRKKAEIDSAAPAIFLRASRRSTHPT